MASAPIRDAATVLLLRGDAPFELFMVRRTGRAAFMANAMVFPGGRLDDADLADALAIRCTLDRAAAAGRLAMDDGTRALGLLVAGVRETFEEAGVLLALRAGELLDLSDPGEAARFRAHRDAMNAGERTLLDVVLAEDLTLAVDRLAFHAHWITPPIESRRYDTRFLVTVAPAGQRPLHDAIETTASSWLTPADALAQYAGGQIELAPPTLRILLELDRHAAAADVLGAGLTQRPTAHLPQPNFTDGELHLLLPGDPQYDPPGEARNRIIMRGGRWVSEGRGC
jgi:8-oxo-dGTP pyrophosphatase MutT (NUDIX family)